MRRALVLDLWTFLAHPPADFQRHLIVAMTQALGRLAPVYLAARRV
jgi:hypothetical protein